MLWHPSGPNTDKIKIFKASASNFFNESYPAAVVSTLLKDKNFLASAFRDAGLDDDSGPERENIVVARVNCSSLSRIAGLHDSFYICRSKGYNAVDERHFAYFIGGRFDPIFVENFLLQTAHAIKIRIFAESSYQPALAKVGLIEEYKGNIRFGSLANRKTGFADVKNIIDLRDDNNQLEIVKFDVSYTDVEQIILSITSPVPICQLLVVLRKKSVTQVARLIKNLNSALYYIYAANRSPYKRNTYYLSFMRFSCGPAYGTTNPFLAKLSDVLDL